MDEDDGQGVPLKAILLGLPIAVVLWAMIALALVRCVGKPEVKPDPRTACERTTTPWAIAERCR